MGNSALYLPEVRQQYEDFPYPPRNPQDENHRLLLPYLSRIDAVNHHCFNGTQNFNNFRVLIAGGGTGDTTIAWAEQLRDKKDSSVVYLDMSNASASIAKERAAIRGLNNIRWINDSILNIAALNLGSFDFIECSGVLHHLKDPDAGLKAIASVLKPNGAMNLMVYAKYGRTGIYQMQDLMRLINGTEKDSSKKIDNTKKTLSALPSHHALNVAQSFGVTMSDAQTDAGLYDLFLHTQDRAYTMAEVHDWLEHGGLKLSGEPGYNYTQLEYLPETYIKDPALLAKIKQYPLKIQQAIGDALSTRMTKHEFYAVPKTAHDRVAKITDQHLIPWAGMLPFVTFEEIALALEKYKTSFKVAFEKLPGAPQVHVPEGKYIAPILRRIDGQRSVGEIIKDIQAAPSFQGAAESEILHNFETLFISLNRGHLLYLRHPSVAPFAINKKRAGS